MTVGEYIEILNKFDKNTEMRQKVYIEDEAYFFNVVEPKYTKLNKDKTIVEI